ncbi:AT-rich interactive domain-containing protein 1-like [Bidens hawaiensis]|uniref:AT-rich interactive domain-containing protein 1-like n=1 Tax=Bidens hawaiensis TaxID=980011 RepID=UPI00404B2BCD
MDLELDLEQGEKTDKKEEERVLFAIVGLGENGCEKPSDSKIRSLPESSKWKAYGSEHVWKQVLLVKEMMSLKVNVDVDSNIKRSTWQKKQKMHPDMYNDQPKNSYTRCSQRLISLEENRLLLLTRKLQVHDYAESSPPESDAEEEKEEESLWAINYKKKRVPLGRFYQAQVPQWTGKTEESETRWLGTRVWLLKETENRFGLVERDPIGKGRHEPCSCHISGSPECVRFHVAEKRARLKRKLGSAFVKWKFDMMGEEVSHKWTKSEEKKFASIIKSNPWSSGNCFWDLLVMYFKNKTRPVLVSYYLVSTC